MTARRIAVAGVITGIAVAAAGLASPGAARAATTAAGGTAVTLPGITAQGIAVDWNRKAYVTGYGSGGPNQPGTVSVIDLASHTVKATIPVGRDPGDVAVDPYLDKVFVLDRWPGNAVTVIDGKTDTVITTIQLDPPQTAQAFHLTYDLHSSQVWLGFEDLTGSLLPGLDVINPVTDTVTTVRSNRLCSPRTVLAADASGALYAVWGNTCPAQVQVLNPGTMTAEKTFPMTNGDPVAAAANGANFYVAYGTNAVSAYSKSSGDLVGSVSVSQPSSMVIDNPSGAVFVAPGSAVGHPVITELNAAGNAVTGTIPVSGPGWIAYDNDINPPRSLVYVANGSSGATVSVIPLSEPAITSADHATFTAGKPGTFRVSVQGTPASPLSMQGRLPAGLTWSPSGVISGTPSAGIKGVDAFGLTVAANGIGPAYTQRFLLTVGTPPAITSANHATFKAGTHGAFTVRTTGYPVAAVTVHGALPTGLKFTAARNGTAAIAGTPASATRGKSYVIVLTAGNGVGTAATQRFTLRVG